MIGPDHYRYSDILSEGGQYIQEEVYQVIKETPGGYWVARMYGYRRNEDACQKTYEARKTCREVRFVLKVSGRRYCYPDRLEAMRSFAARKAAQLKHAETSIAKARHALAAARRITEVGNDYPRSRWTNEIAIGMPPDFAQYSWY